MKIKVLKTPEQLGAEAAKLAETILNKVINKKGKARLILSTGKSQLDTLQALVKMEIDWTKVEMFHLDEYVGLPESHPASFRKYLKERFTNLVPVRKAYFVDGETDVQQNISELTEAIKEKPIDLALIGIGENAHIAFNDPPADFDTKESYFVVKLDDNCKSQQVGEGWFKSIEEVPNQAISMTVYQIMQSEVIISCVPYSVKADAVKAALEQKVNNLIPASILKHHPNFNLFLDEDSACKVNQDIINTHSF